MRDLRMRAGCCYSVQAKIKDGGARSHLFFARRGRVGGKSGGDGDRDGRRCARRLCTYTHPTYLYTNMTDDTTDDTRRSEKGIATPSQPGDRYYCTPPAHSTVRHTLRHTLRHFTHPVASRGLGVHSAVVVVPSRASNAVCAPPAEHSHHRCAGKGMPVAVADRGALPVQGLAHQPLVDRNKRGVE